MDKMTLEFSKLHGWLGIPDILLLVFTLSDWWREIQLVLPSYPLDYGCLVKRDGYLSALRAHGVRCLPQQARPHVHHFRVCPLVVLALVVGPALHH